ATIGAPFRLFMRVSRQQELRLRCALAFFAASKKTLRHSHILQRPSNRETISRRISATQMNVATMRWIGPAAAARRTKKFSTVGSIGRRSGEKPHQKERITASDSRRAQRLPMHRARQKGDATRRALVSRFRSSPEFAARSGANFGIEGH